MSESLSGTFVVDPDAQVVAQELKLRRRIKFVRVLRNGIARVIQGRRYDSCTRAGQLNRQCVSRGRIKRTECDRLPWMIRKTTFGLCRIFRLIWYRLNRCFTRISGLRDRGSLWLFARRKHILGLLLWLGRGKQPRKQHWPD